MERKPVFIKFRKLDKNRRKKKNAGERSGKGMRTHREGETMNEGEHRDGRAQRVCSEFNSVPVSLLGVFEALGHKRCWKKGDHYNFNFCVLTVLVQADQ